MFDLLICTHQLSVTARETCQAAGCNPFSLTLERDRVVTPPGESDPSRLFVLPLRHGPTSIELPIPSNAVGDGLVPTIQALLKSRLDEIHATPGGVIPWRPRPPAEMADFLAGIANGICAIRDCPSEKPKPNVVWDDEDLGFVVLHRGFGGFSIPAPPPLESYRDEEVWVSDVCQAMLIDIRTLHGSLIRSRGPMPDIDGRPLVATSVWLDPETVEELARLSMNTYSPGTTAPPTADWLGCLDHAIAVGVRAMAIAASQPSKPKSDRKRAKERV